MLLAHAGPVATPAAPGCLLQLLPAGWSAALLLLVFTPTNSITATVAAGDDSSGNTRHQAAGTKLNAH